MTISQALRRISKLKGQLKVQLDRAQASVTHREDVVPAFGFGDSLGQADATAEELIKLEAALRVTNAQTPVVSYAPMTLTEATVRLAEHKARIAWLQGLAVRAQAVTKDQVGFVRGADGVTVQAVTVDVTCHLPEAKRAEAIEKAQAAFDALNDAVESTNHRTDLK